MDLAARRAEYEGRGLDRDDLDPDPLVQFSRWLAEAEEASLVEPTAMAVSTAGCRRVPSSRFVLLRGLRRARLRLLHEPSEREGRGARAPTRAPRCCSAGSRCTARSASAETSSASTMRRPTRTSRAVLAEASSVPGRRRRARSSPTARRSTGSSPTPSGGSTDAPVPRPDFWGGYRVRPSRSSSGRGGRTGCTTACATAETATAG